MEQSNHKCPWQVLLIGGASGTGKTSVSYQVARHFEVGIAEVDDFQIILELMTSPTEQPILHQCWSSECFRLPVEEIVELQIAVGKVMMPALEAVVANHIETDTPIVLEGDYVSPALISRCSQLGRVGAVFLHEADEVQILRNFSQREPDRGEQRKRARVNWLYGEWLKKEAERSGLPVVEARPWESVFKRVIEAIPSL